MMAAKTLEELLSIEQRRGYRYGWALHVWRERERKAAVRASAKLQGLVR